MDENQHLETTITFDLPIGIEETGVNTQSGTIMQRQVTMRRVKASDIEGCYSDLELKQLRGEQLTISAENPAGTMVAMGAMYKFFAYLFGRVVTQIGTLETSKINRKLFLELYQVDFNFLIAKYNELNGGEEVVAAGSKAPFAV